jgi:hypothetical protein
MVGGNLITGETPGFEFETGTAGRSRASRRDRVSREQALRHRPRTDERTLRADDALK